ncbi:uncharacterized protein LOC115033083 [Acyrthosiphon pisum]|uniref:Regulatory protein zeste n=1 Tax=Acyrthosiphon pisum TaxID=7029 RepID=A0A8R2NJI4_ACYPI|nr:uncharacterized protein LOC115033083 [Acyrthosiphon pisum]
MDKSISEKDVSKSKNKPFIPDELSLLSELVYKHRFILEKVGKQYSTVADKRNTWESLANEFNSAGLNVTRSSDQLKKKWDNIKQSRKTEIRDTKRHQYTTGGGPSCQPIINDCPADQFLNEITDIELIDTPDSDYIPLHCSVPTTIENKIVSDQPVYFITTTSTSNNISPTSPKECPTGKKDSDKMKKNEDFEQKRLESFNHEAELRIKRQMNLIEQDKTIHALEFPL